MSKASGSGGLIEARAREAMLSLLLVESEILDSCVRLERAEKRLSEWARRNRTGVGRPAVRQIELERQRLGRELHTGVGQMLAAIRLQAELIAVRLRDPEPEMAQSLERITTLVAEALEQVRSVSGRLYPPAWQQLSLEEALRNLWTISGIPEKFQSELQLDPISGEIELEIKILMYRAAQEALANSVRHAQASRVAMSLVERGGRLILTIRDDGVGFNPSRLASPAGRAATGIGLRTIQEQAAALGGKMSVESGPHGTTLEVSVPHSA